MKPEAKAFLQHILEIIGEAIKNLPLEIRTQTPEIPWQDLAGLRDILIRQYFGVDLELVYEVVQKDLPPLYKKVTLILES